MLHPVCMVIKPLFYEPLGEKSISYRTIKIYFVTLICVYSLGGVFYYLVQNPAMKARDRVIKRLHDKYSLQQSPLSP
jgi:hypothetical protein